MVVEASQEGRDHVVVGIGLAINLDRKHWLPSSTSDLNIDQLSGSWHFRKMSRTQYESTMFPSSMRSQPKSHLDRDLIVRQGDFVKRLRAVPNVCLERTKTSKQTQTVKAKLRVPC
jgi:hypothetical protein